LKRTFTPRTRGWSVATVWLCSILQKMRWLRISLGSFSLVSVPWAKQPKSTYHVIHPYITVSPQGNPLIIFD
jgi:hypothetical protein